MSEGGSSDTSNQFHDVGARSRAIDACRVIAAILVIWIHASSGVVFDPSIAHTMLGYIGVPFFTAAAVLFSVRQAFRGESVAQLVSARIRRILVPFLIWAAFYWIATDLVFGRIVSGTPLTFDWREVTKGFTWHLWFLPFVFVMGVGAAVLAKASMRSATATAIVALSAAGGAGALLHVNAGWDLDPRRWPYEMPVVLATLAIALSMQRGWVRVPRSAVFAALALLGVLGLVAYGLFEDEPPARRSAQVAGVLMLLAAIATPDRFVPTWLTRLGTLGFSVYVVHLVILQPFLRLFERDGVLTQAEALMVFVITVVLSFAVARLGRRAPIARHIFP